MMCLQAGVKVAGLAKSSVEHLQRVLTNRSRKYRKITKWASASDGWEWFDAGGGLALGVAGYVLLNATIACT
jgi:hypothetical protein